MTLNPSSLPSAAAFMLSTTVSPTDSSVSCHLDLDAEVDESPVDGEEGRVLAQRPELPALEGKVSVGFLKQH